MLLGPEDITAGIPEEKGGKGGDGRSPGALEEEPAALGVSGPEGGGEGREGGGVVGGAGVCPCSQCCLPSPLRHLHCPQQLRCNGTR